MRSSSSVNAPAEDAPERNASTSWSFRFFSLIESVSDFVQHDLPDGRIVLPLQAAVNVWAGKSYMTILQTVTGFLPSA